MGTLLAKCRIACQIAILGSLGVIGMLLVAGINIWAAAQIGHDRTNATAARNARDLNLNLQIEILQARRHEKDFLLRHDEPAVNRHQTAMQAAEAKLTALAALRFDQTAANQVREAANGAQRYAAAFANLVSTARIVGLNENQGLLGDLRSRVHDVEEDLKSVDSPNARIAMLMMRRHEKDFIARLDPKYAADVKARLPDFIAALNERLPDDKTRARIMERMTAYQTVFARFAAGTLAEHQAVKTLSETYAEIEPLLLTLDEGFTIRATAAEALAATTAERASRSVILSLTAVALVVTALCWIIGRGISQPIARVTRSMQALAKGDLAIPIGNDARRDEIGAMIGALRQFRESLAQAAEIRANQAATQHQAETDRAAALSGMAERIESGAGASVHTISERTAEMVSIAQKMGALAGQSGCSAQSAASAAALALGNAQTVASAAEQLAASIQEINSQISHSTTVVTKAVIAGNETRSAVQALNDRVDRIGAVAHIIVDIASKTNLLALNATIEAARAGEAGKGFAVVANEVKQLANQTRHSTDEITNHIAAVRGATATAVDAADRIAAMVDELSAISSSIAAAVEQQGAATAEIARNVTGTASAVNEISARSADVSTEAEQAGHYAENVLANTRSLDAAVAELKRSMIRIVRTSTEEVDRRRHQRIATALPCEIETPGREPIRTTLADLSEGGACVIDLHHLPVGAQGKIRIAQLPDPFDFTLIRLDEGIAHLAFHEDPATQQKLQNVLARIPLQRAA